MNISFISQGLRYLPLKDGFRLSETMAPFAGPVLFRGVLTTSQIGYAPSIEPSLAFGNDILPLMR